VITLNERHVAAAQEMAPPRLLIGKEERVQGQAGSFEHVSPSTGQVQASVPAAGPRDVDDAVAAATEAAAEWSQWAPSARRRALFRLSELITRDGAELSVLGALALAVALLCVAEAVVLIASGHASL